MNSESSQSYGETSPFSSSIDFLNFLPLQSSFLIIFFLSFFIFYFFIFKTKKQQIFHSSTSISTATTTSSSVAEVISEAHKQLLLSEDVEQNYQNKIKQDNEFMKTKQQMQNLQTKMNDEPSYPLYCYPFDGPSSRTGASMCYDNQTGILIIFGGMYENKFCLDFHMYVTPIDKWIEVTSDMGEGCLYGNVLCFDGRVCVFGGLKSKNEFHTSIRGFDFESKKWETLKCITESQPSPRFNSTLTAVGPNHWVLFGGRGEDGVLFDDMWYLEITDDDEVIWEKIVVEESVAYTPQPYNPKRKLVNPRHQVNQIFHPLPREGHAMVCMDDSLVLIGGHSDSSTHTIPNGCVEVFNLETNQWSEVPTNGQGPEVSCIIGGAAYRVGDTMQILVIGGSPGGTSPGVPVRESLCSDVFCPVYVLDMSTTPYQWKLLPIRWKGPDLTMPPESRCFFSSCFDSESMCLYLHGGMNLHGIEQGGLCLLECNELIPKGPIKDTELPICQETENSEDIENEIQEDSEPIQYADSHFYQEFLELIKPKDEDLSKNKPKDLMSVAPLPM